MDRREWKDRERERKREGEEAKNYSMLDRESEAALDDEEEPPARGEEEPDRYPPLPPKTEEPRARYTTFRHPDGHLVQIDRRDRPYRVDSEGTRFFEHAGRPSHMPPEDWQRCRREAKKAGQTVFQHVGIPDPRMENTSAGPAAAALTVEEITDDEDESDEEDEGNDGDGATGQDPRRSPVGLASPALEGENPVGLDPGR